uniref:TF-B3 domain-containing protein n=1 Tax=Oryza punctata TaxID=4537 RepID=A0A0E0JZH2_ORYPU
MAASPPLPTSIDGAQVLDDMEILKMKYLFGKVLMPSDVFWVTEQLVIPNEHVGKLLDMVVMNREGGFFVVVVEDGAVAGKLWLFRYWKRDNVHCLTKGWGCYVREKGLRAGDTVSFFHSTTCSRFFICCKRTCSFLSPTTSHHGSSVPQPWAARAHHPFSGHATLCLGNKVSDSVPARHATSLGCAAPTPRRRRRSVVHPEPPEQTTDGVPVILESMALVSTPPAAKRVRLFGVYIDDIPPLRPGGEPKQEFNDP